jgi:hypothetical protein
MKRAVWLAVLLVVLTGSARNPAAQARRPDFSGSWRLVASPGSVGPSTGGSSPTLLIVQNDTTLTVTAGEQTRAYNLDGSDAQNLAVSRNFNSALTSQARWIGAALTIATTSVTPMGTWQDLDVYSLDYGPKLVVVTVGTATTLPYMGTTIGVYQKE